MHQWRRVAIMQCHKLVSYKVSLDTEIYTNGQFGRRTPSINPCASNSFPLKNILKSEGSRATISCPERHSGLDIVKSSRVLGKIGVKCVSNFTIEEISDEDDELCPVECVKEFKTDEEFLRILEKAKETKSLVVVDFYRTACGSCKYIEQIFTKLCKGSGDEEAEVVFLKHNVIDEYDEQSEVAERLKIRVVPLFHFYKDGVLLEAFPTRDKQKIIGAIQKYTTPITQDH